jgi:uncharacterized protein YpmB
MYYYLKLILTNKLTKMKRLFALFIVVALALIFLSCESRYQKSHKLEQRVKELTVENPSQLVRIEYLAKKSRVELVRVDEHQYIILGVDNVIVHSEGCPCKK